MVKFSKNKLNELSQRLLTAYLNKARKDMAATSRRYKDDHKTEDKTRLRKRSKGLTKTAHRLSPKLTYENEIPANAVGSGSGVAGLVGDPPVRLKKRAKLIIKRKRPR